MNLLRASLALAFVMLSGCATMTGALMGSVLCGPGDHACRQSFVQAGWAMDTPQITVGGARYASANLYDCRTNEGVRMVIDDPRGEPTYTCLEATGAAMCSCVTFLQ